MARPSLLVAMIGCVSGAFAAVDAPVSPQAMPETGALLRFMDGLNGEYVLSGQQEFPGWSDDSKDVEFDFLLQNTGKRPAVRGFDFLFYTHSVASRAGQHATERAISWSRAGGIVAFCCHLFMDIGSPEGNPQFYVPGANGSAAGTTFDIRQAVIEGTPENREYLAKLDLIAGELKKLRDAHVPVIWRPFHECSGGWFWWGAHGSTPFIQAWRIMFDRFTQRHGLTNLLWEYNPTDSTTNMTAWYPGDDVVDIVSLDIYPAAGTHPTYAADYQRMRAFRNGRKLVAMSENGAIPDPDQLVADKAYWAYFCTWNGFESNPAQNSAAFVNRVFNHAAIVTLDELRGLFAARAFTLVTPPAPQLVLKGSPLTLGVTAHDSGALTYQWSKDGMSILGATNATYSVAAATTADAGNYTVAVAGANGTLVSETTPVDVAATDNGRIINLSVNAQAGKDDQTLIPGFVLQGGSGAKPMLIRAAGPALAGFGVTGFLADPVLQLNATPVVVNDNWEVNTTGTKAELSAAFDAVGAFHFAAGSKDAALLVPLQSALYTATITGTGGTTGTALAEVYDGQVGTGARLINISARALVGGAPLAPGFVIRDDARTVLVRVVGGPTLTGFGVQGALPNPRLELFRDSTSIASNDDWASGPTPVASLQAVFDHVGAFQIDPATRDAVLLKTLTPGSYSAQVTSTDPGSGVALVEVYEVR